MSKKTDLHQMVARLESIHDQLEAELAYVNGLLQAVGFSQGIDSVKAIAKEVIEDEGFAVIRPKKVTKPPKKYKN
jgi:hypothetical protein